MKLSLSYDHWSLRKWRKKIQKFFGFVAKKIVFLRKKVYFDEPHAIEGAWAHFRRESITRRFSEIFRPVRFFKHRKREICDKFNSFCRFCLFSVDKPHQTGQTLASAVITGNLISVAEGFITGR